MRHRPYCLAGAGCARISSGPRPHRGGRSAAKRNVVVTAHTSPRERSASLPPERDTRALRRSTQPSLRRLGFVMGGDFAPWDRASGARTDGFRSLRDRGPPCSCGLWPAFVRPTSSPLLWAAPLSWGGRQTQGVPDAGCESCARAPQSCSTIKTPHDDAPREQDGHRIIGI